MDALTVVAGFATGGLEFATPKLGTAYDAAAAWLSDTVDTISARFARFRASADLNAQGALQASVPNAGAVDADALAANGIPPSVSTPYGDALQSTSPDALAARAQVDQGATLYRIGTVGQSQTAEAQFWSLENPANPGYAARYGIPPENVANADFIETATLQPGASYITRPAPAVGTNPGGGIEVVAGPGGVKMIYFSTH